MTWRSPPTPQPDAQGGWTEVQHRIPIRTLSVVDKHRQQITLAPQVQELQLQVQQPLTLGRVEVTLLRQHPAVLQFRISQQTWLIISGGSQTQQPWLQTAQLPVSHVLWWTGRSVPFDLFDRLTPHTVILTARGIEQDAITQLQQDLPMVYWTAQDGAIQWTPGQGFEPTLPAGEF